VSGQPLRELNQFYLLMAAEQMLTALKWIDVFAFDAPELRERARMAIEFVEGAKK